MSRILMTVRARVAGSRVAPEAPPMRDNADIQLRIRVSLIVAGLDPGAERLDSVAGSEFLDDRLRLDE
jgi:hypothetical protein